MPGGPGLDDITFSLFLVFGAPLALQMVAGGVTGMVLRGTSTAHGLLIGLVVGIIVVAINVGALVLITAMDLFLDRWGNNEWPVILILVGIDLVFAAAAVCLTWRLRKQSFATS